MHLDRRAFSPPASGFFFAEGEKKRLPLVQDSSSRGSDRASVSSSAFGASRVCFMTQLITTRRPLRTRTLASLSTLLVLMAAGCGSEGDNLDGNGSATGGTGTATGGAGTGGIVGGTGAAVGTGGAVATGGSVATGGTGTGVNPTCPGDATKAYQGTPGTIPGTIEAENFDPAGYSDATTGNEGAAYRTDVDADIKALGAGYAVGWMTSGEWLEYTVNVAVEGDYRIVLKAGAVEAGRTLDVSKCDTALTSVSVPQIADWGETGTATSDPVHLTAGLQVIRFTVGGGDYIDLDSITFEATTGGTGGATGSGGGTEHWRRDWHGGAGTGGSSTGGASTGGSGTGGTPNVPKFVGNITTGATLTPADEPSPSTGTRSRRKMPGSGAPCSRLRRATSTGARSTRSTTTRSRRASSSSSTRSCGALSSRTARSTESAGQKLDQQLLRTLPEDGRIDVVNEPPPHTTPNYAEHHRWRHERRRLDHECVHLGASACPNAILDPERLQQHRVRRSESALHRYREAHQAEWCAHRRSRRAVSRCSVATSTQTMKNLLTKMHNDTGLPVYITEYDIDNADDNAQLGEVQGALPVLHGNRVDPRRHDLGLDSGLHVGPEQRPDQERHAAARDDVAHAGAGSPRALRSGSGRRGGAARSLHLPFRASRVA